MFSVPINLSFYSIVVYKNVLQNVAQVKQLESCLGTVLSNRSNKA